VNNADAALAAAQAGQGLAKAFHYAAASHLRSGSLVRLLSGYDPEPTPVFAVWPESSRGLKRVRLLIDHLAGCLRAPLR
jgi:DNA-binding transcriptional LysR family regulator